MDDRSIGVMDSGAGGFTVARAIRRLAPLENIVYFGDSRRNPYGERPREKIVRFAGEIRDFLLARQVKAVVIACNTITFNVPPSFFEAPVPVIGMSTDFSSLPPVRKAAVFATPASIAAHAHRRAMKAALPGAEIIEVPCEGLAHAIETCAPRETILAIVAAAIEKFGASGAEAAVFGCTHYPLVRDVFEELMPETYFLDPAEKTAEDAMAALRAADAESGARRGDVFYFSSERENAEKLAEKVFGEAVPVRLAEL